MDVLYYLGMLLLLLLLLAIPSALILYVRARQRKWLRQNPDACQINFSIQRERMAYFCAGISEIDGEKPMRMKDTVYALPGSHHFEVAFCKGQPTFSKFGGAYTTQVLQGGKLRRELQAGETYRCVYDCESKRFDLVHEASRDTKRS